MTAAECTPEPADDEDDEMDVSVGVEFRCAPSAKDDIAAALRAAVEDILADFPDDIHDYGLDYP